MGNKSNKQQRFVPQRGYRIVAIINQNFVDELNLLTDFIIAPDLKQINLQDADKIRFQVYSVLSQQSRFVELEVVNRQLGIKVRQEYINSCILKITKIFNNSPLHKHNIKTGDYIVGLLEDNYNSLQNFSHLIAKRSQKNPKSKISLGTCGQDGKTRIAIITITELKDWQAKGMGLLGCQLAEGWIHKWKKNKNLRRFYLFHLHLRIIQFKTKQFPQYQLYNNQNKLLIQIQLIKKTKKLIIKNKFYKQKPNKVKKYKIYPKINRYQMLHQYVNVNQQTNIVKNVSLKNNKFINFFLKKQKQLSQFQQASCFRINENNKQFIIKMINFMLTILKNSNTFIHIFIIIMPPKKQKKSQSIKQGKIILKPTLTIQQKHALQKLSDRINLNAFRWQLVNGIFVQCQVKYLLQATQQLNINHLTLNNNKNTNIIHDICIFRPYSKLQNLMLRQNNIQSIECIVDLDAPLLWRIDLGQNYISSMKTFRKMHCPNLVMFRIGQNKLRELDNFQYCYCPQLYQITIQFNQNLTNIAQIIKFASKKFSQIYGDNGGVIISKRLREIFFQRYCQKLNIDI